MATALELTREGWQPYLKGARRRSRSPLPTTHLHIEHERVLGLVRKAADVLKTRFGVRRVILFGSLARTESFYPQADVDLAVEGLTGDDYWEAWRVLEEIIVDRPVDLVDIETASRSVLDAIQHYGTEL
jgi:predicted nucleotidyltransferase